MAKKIIKIEVEVTPNEHKFCEEPEDWDYDNDDGKDFPDATEEVLDIFLKSIVAFIKSPVDDYIEDNNSSFEEEFFDSDYAEELPEQCDEFKQIANLKMTITEIGEKDGKDYKKM